MEDPRAGAGGHRADDLSGRNRGILPRDSVPFHNGPFLSFTNECSDQPVAVDLPTY